MSECFAYAPSGLLLQWHVTDACNLRCRHCYQEKYSGKELSFSQLSSVLGQYEGLLTRLSGLAGRRVRGHVTLTGGEPMARKDFLELAELVSTRNLSFGVLTNGTLLDRSSARKLSELGVRFVQVSLEGTEKTHDSIRGKGNFSKVVSGIECLVREHVPALVSFTAHKGNYKEFPEVASIATELGAERVWADRFIPLGSGAAMRKQVLSPAETREFFEIMNKCRNAAAKSFFNRTEVSMHRALQFLVAGGRPYYCKAGDSLITVQPNGDVYPCRRMPVKVGNVLKQDLSDIYFKNAFLAKLRDREKTSKGCDACFYAKLCRGGLKCLSYAVNGNAFTKDPGCWEN